MHAALEQFWVDLQQRVAGKPDIFQSAYDDAYKPITRNHSKLIAALTNAESLTAEQQDLITKGVLTKRSNLERFTCCSNQPPFRISTGGYWTQDTRFPSNASEFMQQLGFSQPDESSNTPSIWQRIFGTRTLLTTLSTAANQRGFNTYRSRFRGRPGATGSPSAQSTAQRASASSNETARPLLRRQNAFRLTEQESDRLSQQLGLSQESHGGTSGHELLATAETRPDRHSVSDLKHRASTDKVDLQAVSADKTSVDRAAGSVSSMLGLAKHGQQDSHHSFNASVAYANTSRCNPQRWVHLHAKGVLAGILWAQLHCFAKTEQKCNDRNQDGKCKERKQVQKKH